MGIFYNPSKILKLVLFILIINGTSKQQQKDDTESFLSKLERIRWILKVVCNGKSPMHFIA